MTDDRKSDPKALAEHAAAMLGAPPPGERALANSETTISLDLVMSMGADVREILIDLGAPNVPTVDLSFCFGVAPLYFPGERAATAGRLALVYAPHDAHEVKRALLKYGATLYEAMTTGLR